MDVKVNFRNDYVFKRIFAHEDISALLFLINSVCVDCPISSLTIKNPEQPADKVQGKRIYYDVKAQDEIGNLIVLEMQNYEITGVQEDRFVYMACKNYASQLSAGENYDQLKRSEVIIFSGTQYSEHFHVRLELNDPVVQHFLHHRKLVLHFISLPLIEEVISQREANQEALNDLEIMSLGLWRGVDEMTYSKANDEQKKILMIMENRLNALYQDPGEMTYAEEHYFFTRQLQENKELGKEEGKKSTLTSVFTSLFGQLSDKCKEVIVKATDEQLEYLSNNMSAFDHEQKIIDFCLSAEYKRDFSVDKKDDK